MEENKIGVYIKTDANCNVTDINSDIFIDDTQNWTKINEGTGDKYAHAQAMYLSNSLINEDGIYRYKYIDDVVVEKTVEEIENETENNKNETKISDAELIQAEMLLNQERIIAKQKEHDEILAELLLGQQKGV